MKLRQRFYEWLTKDIKIGIPDRKSGLYIGGSSSGVGAYTLNLGQSSVGTVALTDDFSAPIKSMTIKIRPATGGTIVQIGEDQWNQADLYIISDDQDFDRELGKIITMARIKS